jgi:peptidoglycan/xylan/chitin deacetylase (PgdA/CDA1 family)
MRRFYITIGIFALAAMLILLAPLGIMTRRILLASDLLLHFSVLVYGASRISSGFFVSAFCKGDPAGDLVAITFDDGPHPVRTGEILKVLNRFNCRASFFLTGKKVEGNEHLVRELAAAGHSIGNHSFTHSNFFPFYSGFRISREIRETNRLLETISGKEIGFFRPPFGVTNPNVARGLRGLNLRVVGWSIRSFDTRNENPGRVIRRINRKLGGGDIILLHETSDNILQILEQLLPSIGRMGLKCVSLDQMLITS